MRRAATAATIVCVAVVAGSVLLLAVPEWRRALGMAAPDGAAYALGDRIDVPTALYDSAPLTLLLFSRAGCGACQTAKPVLVSLVAALHDRKDVRVLLVVSEGTEAEERQYLQELGLGGDRLAGVNFAALRLQHVPTTVLVDRRGNVRYSLEGAPSLLDQGELLRIAASPHDVR
ncbi:MAG TPA: hypothetical protein VES67_05465 [Vicinamibacterales bacterium]|nr:hypothetical protein [Vicinamibacterales bacterium]